LLRSEPFIFNDTTISFTEQSKTDAPAFAPRVRKGKALGKGRQAPADKVLAPLAGGDKGQDDFRAIVMAKNTQRQGNLEANLGKRAAEADDREGKKARTEL
jgi:hypothetical protein